MKQRAFFLLLTISCLCLLLSGCNTANHGSDGETGSVGGVNASVDDIDQSKDSNVSDKSTGDTSSGNVEPIPITQYGITLSDVVVSDDYIIDKEEPDPVYKFYYPVGMLGLWRSTDDYEGWGYQTFWTYLVPVDAKITFHLTEEINRYWLTSYDLEAVEDEGEDWWNATYLDTYESDELAPGDYTLTREDIQTLLPNADHILCGMGDNYLEVIFDDGTIIKHSAANQETNENQSSGGGELVLGTEASYTGENHKTENIEIALGNAPDGSRNYMSAEVHHISSNDTITIQRTSGQSYYYLNGYTVEKTGDGRWNTVPSGYYYREGANEKDYTLTKADIQKEVPEFDLLLCDTGDKLFFVVFD